MKWRMYILANISAAPLVNKSAEYANRWQADTQLVLRTKEQLGLLDVQPKPTRERAQWYFRAGLKEKKTTSTDANLSATYRTVIFWRILWEMLANYLLVVSERLYWTKKGYR